MWERRWLNSSLWPFRVTEKSGLKLKSWGLRGEQKLWVERLERESQLLLPGDLGHVPGLVGNSTCKDFVLCA